ncbi:erythrocyte membrane protein 1, PfEMP1, putative, partial [Plasmodium sp. DRC-Itaito]
RKPKPPVKLFSVLDIPKGEFDIPTELSSNRYVPYSSAKHRGKRYIYIEGDTDEEKYAFMSDSTDITSSSESEYEEIDTHISHMPKYKTLIEVVLEPSKRDMPNDDIPSDDMPRNEPMNDEEWNDLKQNFISHYLQGTQNDIPINNNISGIIPTNTQPNHVGDNVHNDTHPNTLYDNVDQKPFIMSIHDRNLYTGEEYSYDMITNSGNLGLYSDNPSSYSDNPSSYIDNPSSYSDNPSSYSDNPHPYSGIDLINDSLSGTHDIYDEILKRKENELFGTEHLPKHTTTKHFSQPAHDDPLHNQINLFHKWLDRHRNMCEKWDKNDKVDILDKLKVEWDKDNNSGNINPSDNIPSDIPNGKLSDTFSGKLRDIPSRNNKHSDIPYVLNTDVPIQIDMDKPKPINMEDTYPNNSPMDSILDDLDNKFHEPYFYDIYEDDIYYDVNDEHNTSIVNPNNNIDVPSKIQIELSVKNNKMAKESFPIGDVWGI